MLLLGWYLRQMDPLVSRYGLQLKTRPNQDNPKEMHLRNQITTNASISGYLAVFKIWEQAVDMTLDFRL